MPSKNKKADADAGLDKMLDQATEVYVPLESAESHSLAGTEMECPEHSGFKIVIQQEGDMLFAVCTCQVRNNMFKNQRVWEYTPSVKPKAKASKPVAEKAPAEEGES